MAGGGIGEAMLIGAAMGGGSAAITGGDPLKGALLGGLTGGAGAGIGGALGGAAGGAEGALSSTLGSQVGTEAVTQAGTQAATQAGTQAAAFQPGMTAQGLTTANAGAINPAMGAGQGLSTTGGSVGGLNPATAQVGMQGGTNFALNAPSMAPGSTYALGAPSIAPGGGIANLSAATSAANTPANLFADPMKYLGEHKFLAGSSALAGAVGGRRDFQPPDTSYNGPLSRFRFNPDTYRSAFAEGGIANLASGGYDRVIGEEPMYPANMASGGISSLGTYSDGGRMLRGPGDGMSDSIPGVIGGKRPARLADGEFVVPADVVSHLGNGSTDAGAKHLYSMMDKVRSARTGRKAQGREINANKYVPA